MGLKIGPMLLIAERTLPMDLQSAATTATAPVADNTGRLWNVLVRCNNAPATPPTLGTQFDDLCLGKSDLRQVTVSAECSENLHCSDDACEVA